MHQTNSTDKLVKEIESAFPYMEMPFKADLSFHKTDCPQCDYLRNDVDEYRGKEVNSDLIRYLHQELGCLSTVGIKWILPYYLKFCLTPEAANNMMETEFIIYYLGPTDEYQDETILQLSGLNQTQISCLIHFLEWCEDNPQLIEYCPDEIKRALNFMRTLMHNPSFKRDTNGAFYVRR